MHIDLAPLWPVVNELSVPVLTALAGYLALLVRTWLINHAKLLSAQTDAKVGEALDGALRKGIDFALQGVEAKERQIGPVTVNNPIVAQAVIYARDHAQGAIDHFGKSDENLAEMIVARLPKPDLNPPAKVAITEIPTPQGKAAD